MRHWKTQFLRQQKAQVLQHQKTQSKIRWSRWYFPITFQCDKFVDIINLIFVINLNFLTTVIESYDVSILWGCYLLAWFFDTHCHWQELKLDLNQYYPSSPSPTNVTPLYMFGKLNDFYNYMFIAFKMRLVLKPSNVTFVI